MANGFIVFCALWGSFLAGGVTAKSIPSYVPLCEEHSANISECWRNTFNIIAPRLAEGIPEMKLWKVEPLLIEREEFKLQNRFVSVNAQINDMKLYGFKDMRATYVDLDTDKVVIKMDVAIPQVNMEGWFKAKGIVLDNEFNGKGFFIGNYTKLNIKMIWGGKKFLKKNVTYVTMETGEIDLDIGDIKMKFDGLLPTPSLNDNLNAVINENIDILYKIAKPVVEDTVKAILLEGMNNVFHNFPFNVLYPKNVNDN